MHTKHAGAITIQHNGDWSGEALFIVRLESGTSVSHPIAGHDMRTIAGMIVLEQAQAMAEDLLFDQIGQEGDSLAVAQGRLHRDLQRVDRSASRLAAVLAEEGREIDSSLAHGAARSAREWIPIVAGLRPAKG